MNKKQITELKKLLDEQEVIYRKIGALEEKERIIKLLEERLETVQEFAYAIALIKGENATNFTGSTLPISQQGEK